MINGTPHVFWASGRQANCHCCYLGTAAPVDAVIARPLGYHPAACLCGRGSGRARPPRCRGRQLSVPPLPGVQRAPLLRAGQCPPLVSPSLSLSVKRMVKNRSSPDLPVVQLIGYRVACRYPIYLPESKGDPDVVLQGRRSSRHRWQPTQVQEDPTSPPRHTRGTLTAEGQALYCIAAQRFALFSPIAFLTQVCFGHHKENYCLVVN